MKNRHWVEDKAYTIEGEGENRRMVEDKNPNDEESPWISALASFGAMATLGLMAAVAFGVGGVLFLLVLRFLVFFAGAIGL